MRQPESAAAIVLHSYQDLGRLTMGKFTKFVKFKALAFEA
jgi:hypothetical protein